MESAAAEWSHVARSKPRPKGAKFTWSCVACGTKNSDQMETCGVCKTGAPGSGPRVGSKGRRVPGASVADNEPEPSAGRKQPIAKGHRPSAQSFHSVPSIPSDVEVESSLAEDRRPDPIIEAPPAPEPPVQPKETDDWGSPLPPPPEAEAPEEEGSPEMDDVIRNLRMIILVAEDPSLVKKISRDLAWCGFCPSLTDVSDERTALTVCSNDLQAGRKVLVSRHNLRKASRDAFLKVKDLHGISDDEVAILWLDIPTQPTPANLEAPERENSRSGVNLWTIQSESDLSAFCSALFSIHA